MFIVATIIAKVESAPGGELQHMFHIAMRPGWGAVEAGDSCPPFAIAVLPEVFEHYQVGDELRLEHVHVGVDKDGQ